MIVNVLLWLLFLCSKGGVSMALVDVYVALIIAGRRTFAQVPATLKPAVEAELAALGLGTDGKPLQQPA